MNALSLMVGNIRRAEHGDNTRLDPVAFTLVRTNRPGIDAAGLRCRHERHLERL